MFIFALLFLKSVFFFLRIIILLCNFNLQKPHYMKNSEYEMGFEEISTPFNKKKKFKIRYRKSKVPIQMVMCHYL